MPTIRFTIPRRCGYTSFRELSDTPRMMTLKTQTSALFFFGCLFATPVTLASPDLAAAWQQQAETLKSGLEVAGPTGLPEPLVSDIKRFGRVAGKLAKAGTESHPLPNDLACIFRGMEEETTLQLGVLAEHSNDAEADAAKKRLLMMLQDAQAVAQATILELGGQVAAPANVSAERKTCPSADFNTPD
jgi:hypothetical protein